MGIMRRIFDEIPRRYSISPNKIIYVRFVRVSLGMLLGAHYFACLWYGVGIAMIEKGYDSWINETKVDAHGSDAFESDRFLRYTESYYWAVITLFTTGFGDITAKNVPEMWVSILVVIVGTVYISYLIGLATAYVSEDDSGKQVQNERLHSALLFCEYHALSEATVEAVRAHVKYHHSYNFVVVDAENVLSVLPKHLRTNIESEIASKTLKEIDFLNEFLPLPLIGQIAIKMRSISCNAGHWLYKKNELGDELYIQRTGVSMIYYHHESRSHGNLRQHRTQRGDVIGEHCLFSHKRKHSVKSLTWSEYFVVTRQDIRQVIADNYKHSERVWQRMKEKVRHSNHKRRNISQQSKEHEAMDGHVIHDLSQHARDLRMTRRSRHRRMAKADTVETPPPLIADNEYVSVSKKDILNTSLTRVKQSTSISVNRNKRIVKQFESIDEFEHVPLSFGINPVGADLLIVTDESSHSDEDGFAMVEMKELQRRLHIKTTDV